MTFTFLTDSEEPKLHWHCFVRSIVESELDLDLVAVLASGALPHWLGIVHIAHIYETLRQLDPPARPAFPNVCEVGVIEVKDKPGTRVVLPELTSRSAIVSGSAHKHLIRHIVFTARVNACLRTQSSPPGSATVRRGRAVCSVNNELQRCLPPFQVAGPAPRARCAWTSGPSNRARLAVPTSLGCLPRAQTTTPLQRHDTACKTMVGMRSMSVRA